MSPVNDFSVVFWGVFCVCGFFFLGLAWSCDFFFLFAVHRLCSKLQHVTQVKIMKWKIILEWKNNTICISYIARIFFLMILQSFCFFHFASDVSSKLMQKNLFWQNSAFFSKNRVQKTRPNFLIVNTESCFKAINISWKNTRFNIWLIFITAAFITLHA